MKHKIWNINVAARDREQTASNQKVNDFPLHNLAYSNTGTATQRSVVFPDNYWNRSRFWLDCTFEDIKIFFFLCVKYIQCNTISPRHTARWVTVLFKESLRGSLRTARSTVQISTYSGVQDGLYSKSHSKLTITNYWRIKLSVISYVNSLRPRRKCAFYHVLSVYQCLIPLCTLFDTKLQKQACRPFIHRSSAHWFLIKHKCECKVLLFITDLTWQRYDEPPEVQRWGSVWS